MRIRNKQGHLIRGWLWPKRVLIPAGEAGVVDENNGRHLIKLGWAEIDTGAKPPPAAPKPSRPPPATPKPSRPAVTKKKLAARRSRSKLKEALR